MSFLKTIATIAITLTMGTAFGAETIKYEDAPKFYNQTKTVEGVIAKAFCDDKRCFLNFNEDYRQYLSVVMDKKVAVEITKLTDKATPAELMKSLETMYTKTTKIHVTGALNEWKKDPKDAKGRPQLTLTKTTDIKVVK